MQELRRYRDILTRYLQLHPEERDALRPISEFLDSVPDGAAAISRKNPAGHLTASAMVVISDGRAALIRHGSLGKVLQPGGHIESSDSSTLAAALREVREETPFTKLRVVPADGDPEVPLDMDCHTIPANTAKGEGPHYHFDLRYLLVAEDALEAAENSDLVLHPLAALDGWGDVERLARKSAALLGAPAR